MNRKLFILYVMFVSYSLISMVSNRTVSLDFLALFQLQGDPLLVMVFNMLGVFPIYYVFVLSTYEKQKSFIYILFGLGFMLGAFAIIPGLLLLKGNQKSLKPFQEKMFILLPILLLLMSIIGVLFGNISDYIQLFLKDQFVHIMTIDFFVLLTTPYFIGAKGFPYIHLTKWHV